jgi:Cu-Zn family superoxide dismutase
MVKRVLIAGALLITPAIGLSGCANSNQSANQTTTTTTTSPETSPSLAPGTERLSTQLKSADGTPVANATLDFANGYATITVETVEPGILSPGFHGMHIHSVGKCEANSTPPPAAQRVISFPRAAISRCPAIPATRPAEI